MQRGGQLFRDRVTGKPVYLFIDQYGVEWMAESKWGFRVRRSVRLATTPEGGYLVEDNLLKGYQYSIPSKENGVRVHTNHLGARMFVKACREEGTPDDVIESAIDVYTDYGWRPLSRLMINKYVKQKQVWKEQYTNAKLKIAYD